MREMHIRLKNLGKKTYRKRRNLYKGRLKRKKGIGRKENRRQSIKDFESLVSVTDLMRAMYIKDFDGLVLSEYLPDNEK